MNELQAMLAREGEPWRVIQTLCDGAVYPRSVTAEGQVLLFMLRRGEQRRLGVLALVPSVEPFDLSFRQANVVGRPVWLGLGPTSHQNAAALRARCAFAAPSALGLRSTVGLGDRLGLATPGHIRALRRHPGLAPVLAQQSIREMERTGRDPDQVLDDAVWGVLQEGWREPWGADADHLKAAEDVDRCVQAGYVLYTLDPRDHVDNAADSERLGALRRKLEGLPWEALETTPEALRAGYAGRELALEGGARLVIDEEAALRAACKYGAALAHLTGLYRHLRDRLGDRPCELEVSVDEADTPTSPAEHYVIASELRRLGVEWVSLAPRYGGRFEKGVDYIGDVDAFAKELALHAAVARTLGPYKLSLHSGSDKFAIYPVVARLAGDLVHLKTAGTSYLAALRTVAAVEPSLLREIMHLARARYPEDRASYHVSAEVARMPDPETVSDDELPALIDQFDTRQALHVTFGSVLAPGSEGERLGLRARLYAALEAHEEAHYQVLEEHLARHLAPFAA